MGETVLKKQRTEKKGSGKKKFLVLLILAALLCIIPSVVYLTGSAGILRDGIRTVLGPVESALGTVRDKFASVGQYFTDRDELQAEIDRLRGELAKKEEELYQANQYVEENKDLSAYLGLKEENPDFSFISADVSSFENAGYQTIYTLNRGRDAGIASDMPVLTDLGLVGYVSEVGKTWCHVTSIVDSNAAVGAIAGDDHELGIVVGDLSLREKGLCRMTRLSVETKLKEGDRVYTSGGNGIYPDGLLIGTVRSVEPDNENLEVYATVLPAQAPDTVRQVMILSSYEH